jgi:5-bromo-4-chloroindolyl phosphate hydrolysis protein
MDAEERQFKRAKNEDDELKEKHLRYFRPNLENPANKIAT